MMWDKVLAFIFRRKKEPEICVPTAAITEEKVYNCGCGKVKVKKPVSKKKRKGKK